jgi:hypothetical protein
MVAATLIWNENDPPIPFESTDELFARLERLGVIGEHESGRIVTVQHMIPG